MLAQSFRFLADLTNHLRYRSCTPISVRSSDLYLVEFPKSGITWFSSILASSFLLEAGISIRPSYYNLEQIICDVHVNRDIPDNANYPYYRVIKSHSEFNPFYRQVIYLIRNPFSVMSSYHHYQTAQRRFRGDLPAFVRSSRYGIDNWIRHVNSWVTPKHEMKFHLIRYEDLKDDAFSAIQTLFENLGLVVSGEIIKTAIGMSDFEVMRRSNDLYRLHAPMRNYDFVREGKRNAELDDVTRNHILTRTGKLLERFYPEYL